MSNINNNLEEIVNKIDQIDAKNIDQNIIKDNIIIHT